MGWMKLRKEINGFKKAVNEDRVGENDGIKELRNDKLRKWRLARPIKRQRAITLTITTVTSFTSSTGTALLELG